MSSLKDATVELGDALRTEDITVTPFPAEDLITPSIMLQPAEDYITSEDGEDRTFNEGEWTLTLEAWLLVELQDNELAGDELDALLDHFLAQLPDVWGLDKVTQPGPVTVPSAGWLAHGMSITVSRFINL